MRARILLPVVALALAACGGVTAIKATPVARVDGAPVSSALFAARLASAETAIVQAGGPTGNAAMTTQLRTSVLRSLILDTVIAQEAANLHVAASDAEVNTEITRDQAAAGGAAQLQSQLAAAGGSMLQLQDEIRSQLNEQHVEEIQARQRAALVEADLAAGQGFATLATQFSDDPQSQKQGGLLTLTASQLAASDPAFTKGVAAIAPGSYNQTPIRDSDGFDIVEVISRAPSATAIRRILVGAPQPYTVKARPAWFSEALFSRIQQLCDQNRIEVYVGNAGGNPCTPSSSSSPVPASPRPS